MGHGDAAPGRAVDHNVIGAIIGGASDACA